MVKHGLILDAAFFGWLEANMERLVAGDQEALTHAVQLWRDQGRGGGWR